MAARSKGKRKAGNTKPAKTTAKSASKSKARSTGRAAGKSAAKSAAKSASKSEARSTTRKKPTTAKKASKTTGRRASATTSARRPAKPAPAGSGALVHTRLLGVAKRLLGATTTAGGESASGGIQHTNPARAAILKRLIG